MAGWLPSIFSIKPNQRPPVSEWSMARAPDAALNDARNRLLEAARQNAKEFAFAECLDCLLTIVAIDGTGRMGLVPELSENAYWQWRPGSESQAHGILKMIAKAHNYLHLNQEDLEARYYLNANKMLDSISDLLPRYGAEDIWKVAWPDIEWHISTGTRFRGPKADRQ